MLGVSAIFSMFDSEIAFSHSLHFSQVIWTKPRLITGAGGATARLPVSTGSCRPLFLRVQQLHPARHVPDEEGKVTQQSQGSTSHYGLSDKIETRESLDLFDLDSTSFGAGRVLIFYLRKCFKN